MTPQEKLHQGITDLQLSISEEQELALYKYLLLLEKWNKKFNLTAVRDIDEMVSLHLLDSLSIAPYITGKSLLDVGTGAGIPGIPLAICFPQMRVTLLDSNGKKIRFCRQAILELGLENCEAVQSRVEAFAPDRDYAQITSRAFTSLNNMVKLLKKQLSGKTELLAMKGTIPRNEVELLQNSGYQVDTHTLRVPFVNAERHLLNIRL